MAIFATQILTEPSLRRSARQSLAKRNPITYITDKIENHRSKRRKSCITNQLRNKRKLG